jgi:hypothetical protein
MSPMLTDLGLVPVGKSTLVAKWGGGVCSGGVEAGWEVSLLEKFATAKSGLSSPLKSPMLTE